MSRRITNEIFSPRRDDTRERLLVGLANAVAVTAALAGFGYLAYRLFCYAGTTLETALRIKP